MSAWALYLFFMLDGFKMASTVFLSLSSVAIGVGLLVFCISFLIIRFPDSYSGPPEGTRIANAKEWCERWLRVWKWWRRILIPIFCISLAFNIFLPNTKQAVAIYVIPKVIKAAAQNKELMELPQDVVRVAKLYLNKVMVKWSEDIEQGLSKPTSDTTRMSTPAESTSVLGKAEQAAKDAKAVYDKAMQAVEEAKKLAQ